MANAQYCERPRYPCQRWRQRDRPDIFIVGTPYVIDLARPARGAKNPAGVKREMPMVSSKKRKNSVCFFYSPTNTFLPIPMIMCMVGQGHGLRF
jgi:hypothetical protein